MTPFKCVEADARTVAQASTSVSPMETLFNETHELHVGDLEAGMAGEHLVMADLLLQGYRAVMAAQHCPYDVLVEMPQGLIRIQVKSARGPRPGSRLKQHTPAYQWNVKRAGKNGQRAYSAGEFEIVACVALDVKRIAYIALGNHPQHVQVRVPGWVTPKFNARGQRWNRKDGREFDDFSFTAAVRSLCLS